FFDGWNWHLDTRETATGKDINPDVIGYIFEKYINDRAQMGAYYTKEDITDYISKNCIIPWLFDEVKRNYPKAFAPDGWLWLMVKDSGTDYIYDAIRHGVPETGGLFDDLPPEVQKGFVPTLEDKVVDGKGPWLWELRKDWNKPAPADIALATEIYREVIERRKRCAELMKKIEAGEIQQINDFITCNLNIRQFAQDVVETTEDPDFLRHFYKALSSVTILDPTCGSGAFLFAAMNILEPLYETCIERMQEFVTEGAKGKYKFFEDTLKLVNATEHPNLQYFIYKSIILNNLYGVDIMNEAVEIAKLRLFLKLMATVEADYRKPNIGLEPLPDVDFNIRAGNTLVGYATKGQIDNIAGMFVTVAHKKKILEQCDIVARAFERYKEIQLSGGDDYKGFKRAKEELNERLKKLTGDLDKICFIDQYKGDERDEKAFQKWLVTHKPFHWFEEFYEIVNGKDGFNIVIGNPPYVEYSDVRRDYTIVNIKTLGCGNLFAFVTERVYGLLIKAGRFGFIVPISSVCTPRMQPLADFQKDRSSCLFLSNFAVRPAKLFVGADMNLTIHIAQKSNGNQETAAFSTNYQHWYSSSRQHLFSLLSYSKTKFRNDGLIYKLQSNTESSILNTVINNPQASFAPSDLNACIYYHSGGRYFRKCLLEKLSNEYKPLPVPSVYRYSFVAIYSSSLYYWYWVLFSDTYHVTKSDIESFRYPKKAIPDAKLMNLGQMLLDDLHTNRVIRDRNRKDGSVQQEINYVVNLSKPFIDQIDSLLAVHYGFTHTELDFIINYDIKYRMGKELEGGDEE
ncbi:MAG: hypothetical protein JW902_16585, partial [Syntrophaceae bacterium]|nr:hypothetical protein [Syntrophaceae bacterium]